MKKLNKLIYPLLLITLVVSCKKDSKKERVFSEWEKTIIKNTDNTVKVYGRYAAIKLPIKTGVTLWNPTAIIAGPENVIYAANYTGEIYSLYDTDGDGLEDHAKLYCDVKNDSLRYPTSIAFKDNKMYVATTQEIRVYEDTNEDQVADNSYTFFDDFPWTLHYWDWTFGLDFDSKGNLFAILCTDQLNNIAAPDPNKLRGSILKIAPDGKSYERFATGLRFAYGLTLNDEDEVFFSDNRGNENKYEELNHAVQGNFYGNNPKKYPDQPKVTEPLVKLKYGFSPVGIVFNPKDNDFDGTAGDLFVSYWGPDGQWKEGSVSRIRMTKKENGEYEAKEYPIADKIEKLSDLDFDANGDLYLSQFGTEGRMHVPYKEPMGAIYKMVVADWIEPDDPKEISAVITGNVTKGKSLFKQRACATCHSINGSEEMLGPDLLGIGNLLTKDQIIESIVDPDKNIKTGFDQMRIDTKDGTSYFGRMYTSNTEEVVLVIAGNEKVSIKTSDIESRKFIDKSLMPPGLLGGLNDEEIRDLVGYMQSLKLDAE
ncbi:c-type cytochrome [Seonamhaeicola sp.]|uniref:DUF7133 domain-containing protein n=1 Tax=Seonamhaeicola sp. TaxID=1912245 RepID=UPI00263A2E7F|nr:c-type cytochrome [Seonamhaeicola sp.]